MKYRRGGDSVRCTNTTLPPSYKHFARKTTYDSFKIQFRYCLNALLSLQVYKEQVVVMEEANASQKVSLQDLLKHLAHAKARKDNGDHYQSLQNTQARVYEDLRTSDGGGRSRISEGGSGVGASGDGSVYESGDNGENADSLDSGDEEKKHTMALPPTRSVPRSHRTSSTKQSSASNGRRQTEISIRGVESKHRPSKPRRVEVARNDESTDESQLDSSKGVGNAGKSKMELATSRGIKTASRIALKHGGVGAPREHLGRESKSATASASSSRGRLSATDSNLSSTSARRLSRSSDWAAVTTLAAGPKMGVDDFECEFDCGVVGTYEVTTHIFTHRRMRTYVQTHARKNIHALTYTHTHIKKSSARAGCAPTRAGVCASEG
jgi:hypothetical protein